MLDLSNPSYSNTIMTPSEASLSLVDTPKEEMITSITSSDSKNSNFDDCGASSSAFLSPTEEPELYFDNWSVCSEDRRNLMSPPPLAIPRPMSTSNQEYDPENMLDRIRRKSFYTRFNEKKPKRVSSIVGPGALKDYYNRDSSVNRSASRGPELSKSSTGGRLGEDSSYRSSVSRTKSSSSSSSSKQPLENGNHLPNGSSSYRMTSSDYLNNNGHSHNHHHHHHHHHLPPSTPSSSSSSSRRSGEELRKYSSEIKPSSIRNPLTTSSSRSNGLYSADNRSNSSIYGTYNPKRRISYSNQVSSSGIPTTSSCLDASPASSSYATLGRKPKAYDQRTMSLMEGSSSSSTLSPSLYRRESRSGIDYTNIGR